MKEIRLQVALATSGVASRRKVEGFIREGRVKVNGKTVNEKGFRVRIPADRITFDGKPLILEKQKYYYVLNKPRGVLSTVKDERGRKKVSDYLPRKNARLYPIGRLDKDTTGLILLTNDGELTYRLTHPKFGINRVYEARVEGIVNNDEILRLEKGVIVEGKIARAKKATLKKRSESFSVLSITLSEGRKREVRNMCRAIRHRVLDLKRVAYGPLKLGTLEEGALRPLSEAEISEEKRATGLHSTAK